MKGFIGNITLKRLNEHNYELEGNLSYKNSEIKVTALHGMPTDGSSIPKVMWNVIGSPFVGNYVRSSIIHDALYTSQGLGKLNKNQVDSLFLEMMKIEGVSWWKRTLMYWAVRLGGAKAWNSVEKDGKDYCEIDFINSIG